MKLNLTAGGSSGGEGSLLGSHGSIIGIGTDIAGSIRIPAYCNGAYGFKPTVGRIPNAGQKNVGRDGMAGIQYCTGPLAQSVNDLRLVLESFVDNITWEDDAIAAAIPWRRLEFNPQKKLRLGLILEDKHFPIHPTVMRTLTTAAKLLEQAGHEVISINDQIPSIDDLTLTAWKFFALDSAKTEMTRLIAYGEPIIKSLANCRFPELDDYKGTLEELYDLNIERARVTEAFNKVVKSNKLDAALMPIYQSVAAPHDDYGLGTYTVPANFFDVWTCAPQFGTI